MPSSGNYTLAARPSADGAAVAAFAAAGPTSASATSSSAFPTGDGNARRRLLAADNVAANSGVSDDGETDAGDGSVFFAWEVDLTRPETEVVSCPDPVTTAGDAVFEFSCTVGGEVPHKACQYEYQMFRATGSEVDWESLDWLPTVRKIMVYVQLFCFCSGRFFRLADSCRLDRPHWSMGGGMY